MRHVVDLFAVDAQRLALGLALELVLFARLGGEDLAQHAAGSEEPVTRVVVIGRDREHHRGLRLLVLHAHRKEMQAVVGRGLGGGVEKDHQVTDALERLLVTRGSRRSGLAQIARRCIETDELLLERRGRRAQEHLGAKAVPDADEPEERAPLGLGALLEVHAVQARDEFAHVTLSHALGRALAAPEGHGIEPARQGLPRQPRYMPITWMRRSPLSTCEYSARTSA